MPERASSQKRSLFHCARPRARFESACAQLVKAARGHFDKADEIMSECPRRAVRAPRIMAEVYRAMLEKMVSQGFLAPRTRVRPSKLRIAWIVARHAFI